MKIPAWLTAQIATIAALAVVSALLVHQCNARSADRVAAKAKVEAAQVEAAGVARASEVGASVLRHQVEAYAAENDALKGEVSRLLTAAKGAHITESVHGDTGWISTGGPPAGGAPEPDGKAADPSTAPAPSGRVCLFYEGDEGRIVSDTVKARYAAGTIGAVGAASAFGRAPGASDSHLLYKGPLALNVVVEGLPKPIPTNRVDLLVTNGNGGLGGELVLAHRFDWSAIRYPEITGKVEGTSSGFRYGLGIGVHF